MSEITARVDREVLERAVVRLKELLPSFRDPSHYANAADIALVRHLEAVLEQSSRAEQNQVFCMGCGKTRPMSEQPCTCLLDKTAVNDGRVKHHPHCNAACILGNHWFNSESDYTHIHSKVLRSECGTCSPEEPRCQYVSLSPWGPTQCALPDGHTTTHSYSPSETPQ